MTLHLETGEQLRAHNFAVEQHNEIMRLQSEEAAVRIYLRERDSKDTEIMRLKSLLVQCQKTLLAIVPTNPLQADICNDALNAIAELDK